MIINESFSNYQNAIYDISLIIDSPDSGFELSLFESGKFYSSNLITFSGADGYLFDQSGNFFAGYQSGVPFDLEVHYDYANSTFFYYKDQTLIANGLDITGKSNGATDKSINSLSFHKNGTSELSLSVTGRPKNSLAKHSTSQINDNITNTMSIAANASMLESFTNPNGTLNGGGFNAARSTDFWGKDIDFTSVVVWNNRGHGVPLDFRQRGATAITKRHIIMAKHFKLQASDVVYFVDPDGTWVSRTISATADHASQDISVGVLNEELPDNISFSKVLPSNINDYLKTTTVDIIEEYYKPIVAGFDFEKKLTLNVLTAVNSFSFKSTTFDSNPTNVPDPYDNLAELLTTGDSGNPIFLIIGGEAVLLTSYFTTTGGPSYVHFASDINTLIAASDSAASINTGFKLKIFDIDSFSFFKF
jgi:hypothetical protein